MISLQHLYQQGKNLLASLDNPSLEAWILLQHVTGVEEERFLRESETEAPERLARIYLRLVKRRLAGEPTAYLTGYQEFWSESFRVLPGVFIPRPESELIVEKALESAGKTKGIAVDIGTGSGCLALSLARELPAWRVTATDMSRLALQNARLNARRLGISNARFIRGNLLEPLERLKLRGECDLIISNPPYVEEEEWLGLAREIREHEPKAALVAGDNGMEVFGRLIRGAGLFLRHGGHLLFEIGYGQAEKIEGLFGGSWSTPRCFPDLAGIPRVCIAVKR